MKEIIELFFFLMWYNNLGEKKIGMMSRALACIPLSEEELTLHILRKRLMGCLGRGFCGGSFFFVRLVAK